MLFNNRGFLVLGNIAIAILVSLVSAAGALAQTTVGVDELPQGIISADQCTNVGPRGFGWDGNQSCFISNYRIRGTSQPLVKTSSDYTTGHVVWNRDDLLNKTMRCDSYRASTFSRDETGTMYFKSTLDIIFLDQTTTSYDPGELDLTEATTKIITRGWYLTGNGLLEAGSPIDFSHNGFSTEQGYLLVDSSFTRNGERLVSEFSHCYLPQQDTPLRTSGRCIDFDGDGVGWNGSETCAAEVPDPNCDYSNAASSFGWGYNAVTGESCAPAPGSSTFMVEDRCYGPPNNWGWNWVRSESCRTDDN